MNYKTVTPETLNATVEFDSPFRVVGPTLIDRASGVYAPSVTLYVDRDGQGVGTEEIESSEWEPVTGYSGQHGYSGPVMHVSETLSGGMSRDVLEDVGAIYVVVPVECSPDWKDVTEDEYMEVHDRPAGWMLLKYIGE